MEKHYDHLLAEQEMQKKWNQEKTYSMSNNTGSLFSIDTPPPTVSGNLHIGHIFSYTQTDILARFARMSGKSVFYPFGFDDNGLPTERYVGKKCNIRAHEMARTDFIALCLKETYDVEQQFQELWQKMGLSADWNFCYSTISASTRKIAQESFLRLLQKGYVYRKHEPALYCTTCHTTVAQAELDDLEKPSTFNDIIFTDEAGNKLIISTTRPELLPSVNALFYNPDDTRYQHLKGAYATVPLFFHKIPILADEKVIIEKGTGLVMSSTFGDKTDIEWFKKHNLEYRPMIGLEGKMASATGILAGLSVSNARIKIIEELKATGLLVTQKAITHSVNVHERCKKEIEYIMLSQWFLKLLPYKQKFIELADRITWYPAHMKARYINWVENIGWDWCLSRQRFYGIPFPVWHCQTCEKVITPSFDQLPIDPQEQLIQETCTTCKGKIVPDTDVMDTWNTSSLTPYICFSLLYPEIKSAFDNDIIKKFLPMSMRPQAHDIIRTWAFDTIVKVWMHHDDIPWDSIVISGHVLANTKEKLSKSKDNASDTPQALLKKYPADVIRYWTASGNLGQDIAFSEAQLKIGQRLITKIWNAFRFIKEHSLNPNLDFSEQNLGITNEWLLHSATHTFNRYTTYFKENEFNLALDVIEQFFWQNFCDNYLELIKDQLFNPHHYPAHEVAATRLTLTQVGLRILQLYAPYLPHITDYLYRLIFQKSFGALSLHQVRFEQLQRDFYFADSANKMTHILHIISTVRKLKTEKQLSLKVPLASLTLVGTTTTLHTLKEQEVLIRGITHAQEIYFVTEKTESTIFETEPSIFHVTVSLEK